MFGEGEKKGMPSSPDFVLEDIRSRSPLQSKVIKKVHFIEIKLMRSFAQLMKHDTNTAFVCAIQLNYTSKCIFSQLGSRIE